jgi:lysine biosynthesis protein LysW
MTGNITKAIAAFCPACDTRIRFGEQPRLNDIFDCPECEELFEVVGVSPIVLQWTDDSSLEEDEFKEAVTRW